MTFSLLSRAAGCAALGLIFTSAPAQAFCGVIQESASSFNANLAVRKADRQANRALRTLRRQHGNKLVAEERQRTCVGGGVGIDANGNQIVGKSRCTTTVPFCVNP